MKRAFVLVVLLIAIAFSLFAQESIWFWEKNDSDVGYYRYKTSFSDEWRIVPVDHYSVLLDSGDISDYDFFLQQSYDGINWSESAVNSRKTEVQKDPVKYKNTDRGGFLFSFEATPFQSYIMAKPWDSVGEKKTAYSLSLSLQALYFKASFGFGANASISTGWEEFNLSPFSLGKQRIFGGAYFVISYRVLEGKRYVFMVNGGLGTNFEALPNKTYLSPSLMVSLEGGLKIDESLMISLRPSLSVSFLSWTGEDKEYISFLIKTLSIVSSFKF